VKIDGWGNARRVVGSPAPQAVHELNVIKRLVERGTIVIACGGGGAPIYDDPVKGWEGIDAVIDKDLAAAVLARDLGAALLLILTDVDAVYADWGTPQQRPLRRLTIAEAEAMDRAGQFGEGSMAPKVRAAIDFVRRTGGRAVITVLDRGQAAVRGEAGTTITAETA
jgi:carbamate kinase